MTSQKDFIDSADAKKLEQEVDQEIFKQIEKRTDFAKKRLRSLAEASGDVGAPAYLVVSDDE